MLQDLAQLPLLPAQPQPTLEAEEPARANFSITMRYFLKMSSDASVKRLVV